METETNTFGCNEVMEAETQLVEEQEEQGDDQFDSSLSVKCYVPMISGKRELRNFQWGQNLLTDTSATMQNCLGQINRE